MKKQKKQFSLIICILVLCAGGYFAAKKLPDEEKTTVGTKSHTVTSITQEEVAELSYLYEGNIIELIKEGDVWKSKEDMRLSLDQTVISNMLSYVCSITTETVIENPESLAEYGLTNPENTICLTLSDGSNVQLLVGDYLDITGEYYALVAGDTNVYTISSYIPSTFNKALDMLVETQEETTEEATQESTEAVE